MVQKLEAIKGGGGSIRVGTTGTIGALMTREMESIKPSTQASASASASASGQGKPRTIPVSVPCSASTPRKLQPRKSLDEASSSGCRSVIGHRSPETPRKVKSFNKSTHRMPMLGSDSSTLDRTPGREKPDKKAIHIVEIVDIKCGNPQKAWANPITSKLKKLDTSTIEQILGRRLLPPFIFFFGVVTTDPRVLAEVLDFLHYEGPNSASRAYLYWVLCCHVLGDSCGNGAGFMHVVFDQLKEA
ncbi:hypothetical protein SADUNF_Sadunf16G0282500 [Salix dunnii]|uniref:Uncharacterized protein n=1 Tax=Salix dunnii TaxID=1413687 RepID=A0A835JCP2_9ROSI|nr:hypothetical protein SADUNF_Sadunf16G0282500 [Salix dunnii]